MGENTEQTTNRKTETTAQMNELNKALLELKKITGIVKLPPDYDEKKTVQEYLEKKYLK